MLIELTIEQRKLAEFMSDLSERCYCAGWIKDLEYFLWDMVINGPRRLGQDNITQQDIVHLNHLSKESNSWIYFDDKTEETAIDLYTWEQKFEEAISQKPEMLKNL